MNNIISVGMNNIIVTLHGRDTLDLIKAFEKQQVKNINSPKFLEIDQHSALDDEPN